MIPSNDRAGVVVVGGGPGGCAAALEAARASASVILLEALDSVGGNAARSTGYMAFADFGAQHTAGIVDSPEDYVADMVAEAALQEQRYGVIFEVALARLHRPGRCEDQQCRDPRSGCRTSGHPRRADIVRFGRACGASAPRARGALEHDAGTDRHGLGPAHPDRRLTGRRRRFDCHRPGRRLPVV